MSKRCCMATIEGVSDYIQSRKLTEVKKEKESYDDFEKRIWREKCNYNPETLEVFIPPMALKQCVDEACKRLAIRIPGRGTSTYAKHFEGGVLVMDGPGLGVKRDAVDGTSIWCSPEGKKGRYAKKRVSRTFPTIRKWRAEVSFWIFDDIIPKDVFERVVREAGAFVGIGSFRPENGGYCGRFQVSKCRWEEQ